MNLVDQIKQQFSDADIHELSSMIGASEGATRSAVGAAVPSLLSALSGIASSGPGAQKLVSALGQAGGGVAAGLADHSNAALDKANSVLGSLVGGNALSGIAGGISRFAGVAWGGCQKLLGYVTPAILGTIAKSLAGKPLNPQSLAGLFSEQKSAIANAIPSGLSLPDLAHPSHAAAAGARPGSGPVSGARPGSGPVSGARPGSGPVPHYSAREAIAAQEAENTSGKWFLAVVGLVLLALVGWWLWPKAKPALPSAPAVADLTAQATAWKNDVTGAATSLTETLGTIKDPTTATAALPKLTEIEQKLETARLRMNDMPSAAQAALGSALNPTMTTIKDLIGKALLIPGVGEKLKPITDSILAKLNALST